MKHLIAPIVLRAVIAILGLATYLSSYSQDTIPPSQPWEVGIRFGGIGLHHTIREDATTSTTTTQSSITLNPYLTRTWKKHFFWRVSAGVGFSNQYRESVEKSTDRVRIKQTGSSMSLESELAGGYEFPSLPNRIFNRLKCRIGISLDLSVDLRDSSERSVLVYDGIGNVIETQTKTYVSENAWRLAPMAFFQARYRIFHTLYLGLEWRYGCLFTYSKESNRDSVMPANPSTPLDTGHTFIRKGWYVNNGINMPIVSLGFQF